MKLYTHVIMAAGFLLVISSTMVQSKRILIVAPAVLSLCKRMMTIGRQLESRGHTLFLYAPSMLDLPKCIGSNTTSVTVYLYDIPEHTLAALDEVLDEEGSASFLVFQWMAQKIGHELTCEPLLSNKEAIAQLLEENIEIVITDVSEYLLCCLLIPKILDVPFIIDSVFFVDFPSAAPFLPSIKPSIHSPFTSNMNFVERVQNTFYTIIPYFFAMATLPMAAINKHLPEISRLELANMMSQADLYLVQRDHILGFPLPLMPNVKAVGSALERPVEPLDAEFERLYARSKNGVILVCFGTLKYEFAPELIDRIVMALQKLKYDVFVKSEENKIDGKVYHRKWLPLYDLLAEPKTKLLISHCGSNSLYESIQRGVPVVCLPFGIDQIFNSKRIEEKEVGKSLDFQTVTPDEISTAVTTVISDDKYVNNVNKLRDLFESLDKPVYWVEHVLKYGGQHLRHKGQDMPVYQFMMLDVYAFITFIIILAVYIIYKLLSFCFKKCLNRKRKTD